MIYLVDTSLLIRQADTRSSDRSIALRALQCLRDNDAELRTLPQNLVEFWAVATRPQTANGLGLSVADADQERRRLEALFPLLPEPGDLYRRWCVIVRRCRVSGKPTHDARIVAALWGNRISHILTFNGDDFRRYAPFGLVIVDPAAIR